MNVVVGQGTPLQSTVSIPESGGAAPRITEVPLPTNKHIFSATTSQELAKEELQEECQHELSGRPTWKKGMLPGGKLIKTCTMCGVTEPVADHAVWITLP